MVRDHLLGKESNDIDIATSASAEQVRDVFADCRVDEVGKTFGVMIVNGIEVAMFRSEKYDIQSKPTVEQATSFYEDASRRDFTINAMAMTIDNRIIDYFEGEKDIKNRIIRAVGNPDMRFLEDPSRILRAVYLASKLGFDIEKNTLESMRKCGHYLNNTPNELKGKIVNKVIKYNCLSRFVEILETADLLDYIFPEISHTVGVNQNPEYHHLNVFEHILAVINAVEKNESSTISNVMSLSALFHDNAKGLEGVRGVNNKGLPNDLGHEEAGVDRAIRAIKRIGLGNKVASDVGFIVRFHGIRLPARPKNRSVLRVLRKIVPYCRSKSELKNRMKQLYDFMYFDNQGFNPKFREVHESVLTSSYPVVEYVLDEFIFYRDELPVDGKYLMSRGLKGKEIGDTLDLLVSLNMRTKEEVDQYLHRKLLKNFN